MPEQMISHYRVVRRLGAGGMGEVLLAQDTKLERFVAIKLMSAQLAQDPNQRKRFQSEARAASGLNHPNICVIHEVGEAADGRPFLAMEFVEGQTLEVILQKRRVKLREAVSLGAQIADALDAAHARGIVHRDIKPGNIMLDRRGQAKVLDFGLAKKFGSLESTAASATSSDTATGFLVGTPHYMSPEQALGGELDQRSDIFSLGVVLYELVAGQRPFLGKTVGETINKIINEEPRPLGLDNPRYSPALDEIIFKCLAKKPEDRYASAKALAEDLARLKATTEQSTAVKPAVALTLASDAETKLWQLAGKSRTQPAWVTALIALVALGLLAALVAAGWRARHRAAPASDPEKSVAVLPFDNFSAEKDTDYLSDGLTEEITTTLSRIPGLKVAARNSAFTFKGKKEDLRKVGAMLGVTTVLEGSLRKAGRQIRVTAQLVNVADGFHLWSETYDSSMEDIFAVQEEIARKIAERFALKPGGSAVANSASRHQPKEEAHNLYMQGLHAWNLRTPANLERAVQLFNQAVEKDPAYADAYGGLALCYVLLPSYLLRPNSEYFPQARAAAAKALELDPSSADAHAVLGLVKSYSNDYAGAEEEFNRALQLNQNHATAHHWAGVGLRELGRFDETWRELRRAKELDPLSPIIHFNLVATYLYTREFDRGIEESRKALQEFPDFPVIRGLLAGFLTHKGRYPEAIEELLKLRATSKDNPSSLDALAFNYARSGDAARARQILAELQDWKKKGYAVEGMIGGVHFALREYDRAFDHWEASLAAQETLQGLLQDPLLDEVRAMPRFQALIKKAGLGK
ncbi:MAG: tetratricopeptide repeat protein [Pedosphaera sp.]|nr:tetratricopeptide repeat protein [Pedosphaera sp.]